MNDLKNPSPSIIARETLLKLASLKLQPTPDNYHKIYDEIAGIPNNRMSVSTIKMLSAFTNEFPRHTQELTGIANMLEQAITNKNWNEYKAVLMNLAGYVSASNSSIDMSKKKVDGDELNWADTISRLLKQLETNHGNVTIARKREGLRRVLTGHSADSSCLHNKICKLVESWNVLATDADNPIEVQDAADVSRSEASACSLLEQPAFGADDSQQSQDLGNELAGHLQELLVQVFDHVASAHLEDASLSGEAHTLAQRVRKIQNKQDIVQFANAFKHFLDRLEYCAEDNANLQKGLLKLLDKILTNATELFAEDEWVRNQLTKMHETISRPLDKRLIIEAEGYLEKIIERQGLIRNSLGDARTTFKKMVTSLIGNVEELSDETGEYHDKIENYTNQISKTDDLVILNQLLTEVMKETRQMQESTKNYRNDFLSARAEVAAAEEKIVELESELQQMSEKIHEDHLTGILNRRGLDLAFSREISYAKRQQTPVCYALLDIDNFKVLNDTYGHNVGDEALVYLVDSVKNITRNEDIVARYGGEEFVILLPNTRLKEAVEVLSRIRREMTKKFFLHENKKILVTFSAGVAEYKDGEMQEAIFKRADEALYRAKKNGKNLILEAV